MFSLALSISLALARTCKKVVKLSVQLCVGLRSASADRRKYPRLLWSRDARRRVITRILLHIAKPADALLFASPRHPAPPLLCALSGWTCPACGPDASLLRVPLLLLSHLQGGITRGGRRPRLDFLLSASFYSAIFLTALAACSI